MPVIHVFSIPAHRLQGYGWDGVYPSWQWVKNMPWTSHLLQVFCYQQCGFPKNCYWACRSTNDCCQRWESQKLLSESNWSSVTLLQLRTCCCRCIHAIFWLESVFRWGCLATETLCCTWLCHRAVANAHTHTIDTHTLPNLNKHAHQHAKYRRPLMESAYSCCLGGKQRVTAPCFMSEHLPVLSVPLFAATTQSKHPLTVLIALRCGCWVHRQQKSL